jgi:hypothetical protein
MLNSLLFGAIGTNKIKIKLHIGDPGEAGTANPATETTEKEIEITKELTEGGWLIGRVNLAAIEWIEVKAKETYKWISIRDPSATVGTPFILAIELTAPVEVNIGDTFRINKEKLIIKLKKS